MDSKDEFIFHQMMEDDVNALPDEVEHSMIINILLAAQEEMNALPKHGGGSKPGAASQQQRRRVIDHGLLYNDYIFDNPIHGLIPFWRPLGCISMCSCVLWCLGV